MKIHGLDLDNSPLISQDKALRYAENIAIGEGNQSYINEDGFELKFDIRENITSLLTNILDSSEFDTEIFNNGSFDIIGTIPTNIGVVLFCVFNHTQKTYGGQFYTNCIVYLKTNENDPYIHTLIYDTKHEDDISLNFSVNHPIHGDYIYNYKQELIITFTEGVSEEANETRILNIDDPDGCDEPLTTSDGKTKVYTIITPNALNLIPDVEYPTININVEEGGNLKSGAYQIAIAYKLKDNSYTNYSILSVPVIVCGKYGEDIKPDIEINRKIIVNFNEPANNNFTHYKLAIVHCTDTAQNCYETEDVKIENTSQSYIISNLINYDAIVLDDIFIKNISYIKEQTLVNYNNRLIRGNVQTLNYKGLNEKLLDICNNHITITQDRISSLSYSNINTDVVRYFKTDETYVLFAGFFDYKGDLINIYHIPNGDEIGFKINKLSQPPIYVGIKNVDTFNFIDNYSTIDTDVCFNYIPFTFINDSNRAININPHSTTVNNKPAAEATITNLINERDLIFSFSVTAKSLQTSSTTNRITITIYERKASGLTSLYSNSTSLSRNSTLNLNVRTTINFEANESKSIVVQVQVNGYTSNSVLQLNHEDLPINTVGDYYTLNAEITNVDIPDQVKSVAYFYIEHNMYNSHILSQGLLIGDTDINNFNTTIQQYEKQFEGNKSLRFYPFEFLYNKIPKLNGNLQIIKQLNAFYPNTESTDKKSITISKNENESFVFEKSYNVLIPTKDGKANEDIDLDENATIDPSGIRISDTDVLELKEYDKLTPVKDCMLEYIEPDNVSLQNISGDSFYRIINKNVDDVNGIHDIQSSSHIYNTPLIAELINPSENLYSNIKHQKLQIASRLIPLHNNNGHVESLIGDTFISHLTLRITTPSKYYCYGDSERPGLDSNNTVYRWILTFPIESRFNLNARYGANIINKPYFLHNGNETQYKELLGLNYKVDNFINTSVGKGYNPVYNENGVEDFEYYDEIPETYNHPHRVIRSLSQSSESVKLNWRTFKTDDYKDMPFNRGDIISLKTDNKTLYIQQKYGLHLLQQRDQLNNDDANNSYLGTSDLFNMEPKEIVYSPSGYIGCESYFDTDVNIAGYVVIDAIHKKIFLINGDKPLEISNIKAREYFEKLIDADLINPYNKQGRIINYNEDRNILYITQINNNDTNSKTMSFSPLNKSWVSFHTYIPDLGFVNRNGLFWGKNGKLYQPNSTIKGKYFGTTAEPSVIQFILNENTIYNKLLKTIVWKDQVSYKGDDYIQHFFKETINHIMVHNFDQCSGKLNVAFNESKEWWNGDTGTNKINLWRFNKLFDLVKPDNTSLFMKDAITPDLNTLRVDYKWYDVNRFICQFIYLTLWCNNTNNHEWELIDVHPEWQLDNRNDQTYTTKENNQ